MNNWKKLLLSLISTSLILPMVSISAATQQPTDGKSLVPVREIAEKNGAVVSWQQETGQITIRKNELTIVVKVGEKQAIVNGQVTPLDNPVQLTKGVALVDGLFLTEVLKEAPEDMFISHLSMGNGKEAAHYVQHSVSQVLSPTLLSQLWTSLEGQFGKITSQPLAKHIENNTVHYNVTYTFKTALTNLDITVRMNHTGLVDDLHIAAAVPDVYQKPSYDNPSSYTEQKITIGDGELALPGTLTLPKGDGPFPVIILVHGSGPNNQDSAIGGAKPFRDLAVGLASQGIAVLRYDKVTYEHTYKVASQPKFTLKQESVDHVTEAVQILKKNTHIDSTGIFVAGHSQGGFALPLIIAEDKQHDIAGGILLAAPSSSFVDVLTEQQDELVKRVKQVGLDTENFKVQADFYKKVAALVKDPKYSVDHLPESFPLQPAYWWFEQKDYVPSELAKTQNTPMLIIQGENDVQVSMKQFQNWKSALQGHSNVTYKSYPKVNHILSSYDGISIGQEYIQPSNVSKDIIDDIAKWVLN
ncbi:stalk domain-containing protein [Paenibacillus pabuli]|uniref:stalk domain-containing protein n=1 Tax=Paenibacillus pabuli TaxID=1472 RepID=UPI001FFFEC9D|nr:stalk domain-containing protein [Paenibacillus pabuli]UPK41407.1 prolyl oligopeptidase family serine peptidase [Paenibacillus pabuli]